MIVIDLEQMSHKPHGKVENIEILSSTDYEKIIDYLELYNLLEASFEN